MQRYNLSSTALASMIGGRSELKKVLLDDGTEAKRNSLYEKLKKSMLFSEEDYFELEHSLLVSRNGIGHYRFHRHVQQLMKISDPPLIADILLENGTSIEERLTTIIDADQIEILCINSCFISLTEILRKLFFSDPTRNVTMWHLFHADAPLPFFIRKGGSDAESMCAG